jgi:hypothetical protein
MLNLEPASNRASTDHVDPHDVVSSALVNGAALNWDSMPVQIDAALAAAAKEAVWPRVSGWLMGLLDYPGFREWKNEAMRRQMHFTILPQRPVETFEDFRFDTQTLREHDIVAGYVRLSRAATDCRATQHYFRRYPFRGLPIGRDEHLRTCAELYYSRVYQFRERLFRLLIWIERRTQPKGLDVKALKEVFDAQLQVELDARHRIHHEEAYTDFELDALGQTDLLSSVNDGWPRMSDAGYHRIAREWRQRVVASADKLDFWVGAAAVLMLVRCRFLLLPPEPDDAANVPSGLDGEG